MKQVNVYYRCSSCSKFRFLLSCWASKTCRCCALHFLDYFVVYRTSNPTILASSDAVKCAWYSFIWGTWKFLNPDRILTKIHLSFKLSKSPELYLAHFSVVFFFCNHHCALNRSSTVDQQTSTTWSCNSWSSDWITKEQPAFWTSELPVSLCHRQWIRPSLLSRNSSRSRHLVWWLKSNCCVMSWRHCALN